MRLVGDRYDIKTDVLTIVTENCPLRKQNYDYAMYLLTALYHESCVSVSQFEMNRIKLIT
jgi:small subunit ribosomal protein S35